MSGTDNNDNMDDNDTTDRRIYKVGYREPPVEHRFKPGVTGNPRGRPKKMKTSKLPKNSLDPFRDLFLREMSRLVPVREGEQISEITFDEALIRQVQQRALGGDFRAQKFLFEARKTAQEEISQMLRASVDVVTLYKMLWVPGHLPHRDHMNVSNVTAAIEFTGPRGPEQKKAWDEIKFVLRGFHQRLDEANKAIKEEPDNPLHRQVRRKIKKRIRACLRLVPEGWDWKETIDPVPLDKGTYKEWVVELMNMPEPEWVKRG